MTQLRIYLAGGFHSGWQDRIIQAVSGVDFIDPRIHKLQEEAAYTLWDLEAIRSADWVFIYWEASNPGGYNLAFEAGFAKALGKRLLLIDEKSSHTPQLRAYVGMIHATADITPPSFAEACKFVQTLALL